MNWSDLCAAWSNTDAELRLMDTALAALSRSRDVVLHAAVSAAVPTLPTLCAALDKCGVEPPSALGLTSAVLYRTA